MYKYAYIFNPDTGIFYPDLQSFDAVYDPGNDCIIDHVGDEIAFILPDWCFRALPAAYKDIKEYKRYYEQHQ